MQVAGYRHKPSIPVILSPVREPLKNNMQVQSYLVLIVGYRYT